MSSEGLPISVPHRRGEDHPLEDEPLVAGLRADGIAAAAVPLWMRDLDTSAALAAAALAAGLEHARA